jgi:hypothetical protein
VGNVSRFENFLPTFRSMPAGGKTSKKRAAPSQIGPKPKKIKPSIKDEKPSVVKRGRPVTQTHDSDTSSDEKVENSRRRRMRNLQTRTRRC